MSFAQRYKTRGARGRRPRGLLHLFSCAMIGLLACAGLRSAAAGAPASQPALDALIRILCADDTKATIKAIDQLSKTADPRLIPFLEDFVRGSLYVWQDQPVLGLNERKLPDPNGGATKLEVDLCDPLTRQPIMRDGKPVTVVVKDEIIAKKLAEAPMGPRERKAANSAITALRFSHPDKLECRKAIVKAGDTGTAEYVPALQALLPIETDKQNKWTIEESLARIDLERGAAELISRYDAAVSRKQQLQEELKKFDTTAQRKTEIPAEIAAIDPGLRDAADETKNPAEAEIRKIRHEAAKKLGDMQSLRAASRLKEAQAAEVNPEFAAVYAPPIQSIGRWQRVVDWAGYLFSGLSAGSILILVALGLSIIFGVMGVINMAQGELVMIGAYATYITQLAFQRWFPESAYDWYFLVAIPFSFIVAALVGMLIEVTVVRRLYGRPLDTLLATFGIGLILTQSIRMYFGDNIGIKAPSWLQKGWEVVPDIVLPYNRMFAIGFCAACVVLMYLIIGRTKLGLLLRATTQNRQMSGALGVPTKRVDMMTFALGAGLAGMAGCALTPIEGVTPNMGQNYIIDSFLVVVTGGVGKLAGAIWAGLGLGMINKLLEPIFQTVWAKVLVLGLVVAFLQKRPSGLFPAKGRLADV